MLLQAAEKYEINFSKSIMIGDKQSDVQAGKNAGVDKCILVASQYTDKSVPEADLFANDLFEALEFLKAYCED